MAVRLSASDRRQQIVQVAQRLFARKGFQGTTTREIAQAAGVNEALLFRHFENKEALYWTVIEELCSARGRRQRISGILNSGGSDFEVFQSLALDVLKRDPRDAEFTRLLWFSALENHRLANRFFRTFVASYYEALAEFIRARIAQGAFREVDPLLSARGFLGMVVYHFLIQELFGAAKYQSFEPEEVASTLTRIWLAGMQAAPAHTNGNGKNGRPTARRAGKPISNKRS